MIVVFAWLAIDRDRRRAHDALRPTVDAALEDGFMQAQVSTTAETGIVDGILKDLTVSGEVENCATGIRRLWEAGADAVILQPIRGREREHGG